MRKVRASVAPRGVGGTVARLFLRGRRKRRRRWRRKQGGGEEENVFLLRRSRSAQDVTQEAVCFTRQGMAKGGSTDKDVKELVLIPEASHRRGGGSILQRGMPDTSTAHHAMRAGSRSSTQQQDPSYDLIAGRGRRCSCTRGGK